MTTFVDYAWWQVTPAQLKSMGFSGAMRYGVPGNTKSATANEVSNLRVAGFDLGLVYETIANRSAQGLGAGRDDAVSANQFADALGYPKSATLWYAVDFDANPSQVQPYFNGIGTIVGRPYAPYGGYRVIEGVVYSAPWGWQTHAWSLDGHGHLQVSRRAGLMQDQFKNTYDSNTVLVPNGDFGQWLAPGKSHPGPNQSPVEEDVRPIRFTHKGYTYLTNGVFYRWVGSPEESKFYDGKVLDWDEVPDVVFNALVPWNAGPQNAPGPTFP